MTSSSRRRGLALGLVGALTLATPSLAGPVLTSTTGVKAAAADGIVDVRWRHRGGAGVAAGLAFGALAGAAIGAATAPRYYGYPAYSGGYYPTYYGDSYPAYGTYPAYGYTYPAYGGYAYGAPAYSYTYGNSYAYPNQTCGVYGGYGRWDYSQC